MRKFDRLVHRGVLTKGKLVLENPKWFRGMLSLYDDCEVTVLVERRKTNPTAEQWGYLWGVIYPEITRHTGHSPDELHEIFKARNLSERQVWRGTEITTVKGAHELTRNELAEFITEVVLEAQELGIEVPPPDKEYQWKP